MRCAWNDLVPVLGPDDTEKPEPVLVFVERDDQLPLCWNCGSPIGEKH